MPFLIDIQSTLVMVSISEQNSKRQSSLGIAQHSPAVHVAAATVFDVHRTHGIHRAKLGVHYAQADSVKAA